MRFSAIDEQPVHSDFISGALHVLLPGWMLPPSSSARRDFIIRVHADTRVNSFIGQELWRARYELDDDERLARLAICYFQANC